MGYLPCPFCGSKEADVDTFLWRVRCKSCNSLGSIGESPKAAADAWNQRALVDSFTPADYLQSENDCLKGQIEQLENYAADLRIAMRKARKMLKPTTIEGLDIKMIRRVQVDEACRILKEALKTE